MTEMLTYRWVSFVALALFAMTGQAEGTFRRGQQAAQLCVNCHVQSTEQMKTLDAQMTPILGRQQPEYLINALQAYGQRQRNHFFMRGIAAGLDEGQRAEVVEFFVNAPAQPETRESPKLEMPSQAVSCVGCHGDGQRLPVSRDIPVLAGQHAIYIQRAFESYARGARKHPLMESQARDEQGKPTLTTDEIKIVSNWFAGLSGGLSSR